ncbi:serine/arginine repetitive matrix protein 1-like [Pollicipes pollicipes]|uniref:serine/arginine repetitive matrix protein 1-like n=1 Tax=Pollicipes pollicipes TaxID=41117 RepID=UPI0018855228|nr:serine/arginine repetitive matrix protein 1-like [Pollicipes pollicipes]
MAPGRSRPARHGLHNPAFQHDESSASRSSTGEVQSRTPCDLRAAASTCPAWRDEDGGFQPFEASSRDREKAGASPPDGQHATGQVLSSAHLGRDDPLPDELLAPELFRSASPLDIIPEMADEKDHADASRENAGTERRQADARERPSRTRVRRGDHTDNAAELEQRAETAPERSHNPEAAARPDEVPQASPHSPTGHKRLRPSRLRLWPHAHHRSAPLAHEPAAERPWFQRLTGRHRSAADHFSDPLVPERGDDAEERASTHTARRHRTRFGVGRGGRRRASKGSSADDERSSSVDSAPPAPAPAARRWAVIRETFDMDVPLSHQWNFLESVGQSFPTVDAKSYQEHVRQQTPVTSSSSEEEVPDPQEARLMLKLAQSKDIRPDKTPTLETLANAVHRRKSGSVERKSLPPEKRSPSAADSATPTLSEQERRAASCPPPESGAGAGAADGAEAAPHDRRHSLLGWLLPTQGRGGRRASVPVRVPETPAVESAVHVRGATWFQQAADDEPVDVAKIPTPERARQRRATVAEVSLNHFLEDVDQRARELREEEFCGADPYQVLSPSQLEVDDDHVVPMVDSQRCVKLMLADAEWRLQREYDQTPTPTPTSYRSSRSATPEMRELSGSADSPAERSPRSDDRQTPSGSSLSGTVQGLPATVLASLSSLKTDSTSPPNYIAASAPLLEPDTASVPSSKYDSEASSKCQPLAKPSPKQQRSPTCLANIAAASEGSAKLSRSPAVFSKQPVPSCPSPLYNAAHSSTITSSNSKIAPPAQTQQSSSPPGPSKHDEPAPNAPSSQLAVVVYRPPPITPARLLQTTLCPETNPHQETSPGQSTTSRAVQTSPGTVSPVGAAPDADSGRTASQAVQTSPAEPAGPASRPSSADQPAST